MTPDSRGFLDAIELTRADAGSADAAFTAITGPVPWPKAYGGDLVAQALAAATATVDADRGLHSTHASFLRPADIGAEVRYEVERTRDGRSFSSRFVRGYQHGHAVVQCVASFQVPQPGPAFAPDPETAPDPESLPTSAEAVADHEGAFAQFWAHGRSFEMRHVSAPLYYAPDRSEAPDARQQIWLRAFSEIPRDPAVQRLALAWICDAPILEPYLRLSGTFWTDPGLSTASLDHAMWFHADGDLNDWVLYTMEAVGGGSQRGLVTGRFTDRSGRLLATVAQEGLVRRT